MDVGAQQGIPAATPRARSPPPGPKRDRKDEPHAHSWFHSAAIGRPATPTQLHGMVGANRHTHIFAMDVPACGAIADSVESKASGHGAGQAACGIVNNRRHRVRNFVRAAQNFAQR
ncbi:hypothetical protein [Azospirillum largimobile]